MITNPPTSQNWKEKKILSAVIFWGVDFRHFAKFIFKEEYSIANFPYLLQKKFEKK
jgi:hypothetical protein